MWKTSVLFGTSCLLLAIGKNAGSALHLSDSLQFIFQTQHPGENAKSDLFKFRWSNTPAGIAGGAGGLVFKRKSVGSFLRAAWVKRGGDWYWRGGELCRWLQSAGSGGKRVSEGMKERRELDGNVWMNLKWLHLFFFIFFFFFFFFFMWLQEAQWTKNMSKAKGQWWSLGRVFVENVWSEGAKTTIRQRKTREMTERTFVRPAQLK